MMDKSQKIKLLEDINNSAASMPIYAACGCENDALTKLSLGTFDNRYFFPHAY